MPVWDVIAKITIILSSSCVIQFVIYILNRYVDKYHVYIYYINVNSLTEGVVMFQHWWGWGLSFRVLRATFPLISK